MAKRVGRYSVRVCVDDRLTHLFDDIDVLRQRCLGSLRYAFH